MQPLFDQIQTLYILDPSYDFLVVILEPKATIWYTKQIFP